MHVNESKLFFGKELLLVKVVTTKFIPEKHYVCPRKEINAPLIVTAKTSPKNGQKKLFCDQFETL